MAANPDNWDMAVSSSAPTLPTCGVFDVVTSASSYLLEQASGRPAHFHKRNLMQPFIWLYHVGRLCQSMNGNIPVTRCS